MDRMMMDELDRRLRRSHDPSEGTYRALLATTGDTVLAIAQEFNPFIAAAVFVVAAVAAAIGLSFAADLSLWVKFPATLVIAAVSAYVGGKLGNAIIALAVLLAIASVLVGAVGGLLWLMK